MRLTCRSTIVGLCTMLVGGTVWGQEPPPAQPAPTTTPAPTEPTTPMGTHEASPTTEAPKTGSIDEEAQETEPETHWGFGARSYFTFVPQALFNLFVEHSTTMKSVSFAASLIRRKGNFDIQFTLEYGKFAPDDGLWQEKDEDPSMIGMYPDVKRFHNLGMVSLDASFIWHVDLTDFMQFRYGAGIGVGVKTGKADGTDTICDSTTTLDDLDDPHTAHCNEVPSSNQEIDIPPVLPVINLLVGLRFKLVEQLSINIETGFRFPAFFVGGGIGYFF